MSATSIGLAPAFACGAALGALFLASLWWSVRRLEQLAHPGLFMAGSFAVRMLLVLGGFYLLSDGGWRNLVAALAGFTLVRILAVRRLRGARQRLDSAQGEN